MLRAIALAARLDFRIDRDTAEAVRALRGEIVRSSPARILEELYKILRQGRSRETTQMLHEYGLLAYLLPTADRAIGEGGEALLGSLSRLDTYRRSGRLSTSSRTHCFWDRCSCPSEVRCAGTPWRLRPGARTRAPDSTARERPSTGRLVRRTTIRTSGWRRPARWPPVCAPRSRPAPDHPARAAEAARGSGLRGASHARVPELFRRGGPLAGDPRRSRRRPARGAVARGREGSGGAARPCRSRPHGGAEVVSADEHRGSRRRRRRRRGPRVKPGAPA